MTPVFVLEMKNKKDKRKKRKMIFIPDLTKDGEVGYVKNLLLVFLYITVVLLGVVILEFDRKMQKEINFSYIQVKNPPAYERKIKKMVKNRPLAVMIPYISKRDERTAGFLVAIAKKESDWGKYSPKKGKKECYNYWGFRGAYNQTSSGYSCFDSPEQAVEVVGDRIRELTNEGINTPEKMVVWKCGQGCSEDDSQRVQKWINDVEFYYRKIRNN